MRKLYSRHLCVLLVARILQPSLLWVISDGCLHVTDVIHISDVNLVTCILAVTNMGLQPSLILYSDVVPGSSTRLVLLPNSLSRCHLRDMAIFSSWRSILYRTKCAKMTRYPEMLAGPNIHPRQHTEPLRRWLDKLWFLGWSTLQGEDACHVHQANQHTGVQTLLEKRTSVRGR